jgi:asparagine synthase (glutamine-hydrolysing)
LHAAMLNALLMYGPDREFSWSDGSIALGGNVMALLPEDTFDRQPLWTPDHSACLVADVRLDNRSDLARELSLIQPEGMSDAEILLAAWLRWDAACLDHIVGGFAFAVWTPARQELFAARDHAGERPLFYHSNEELFALASMPKGLLAIPGVYRGFDERRLASAMVLEHGDWTRSHFAGIQRLPPGHSLRATPAGVEFKPYWHPNDARPTRYNKDEDYVEALLEIFDRATEARLRSTKAIGTELSSGLDSSSVTSSAARLLALRGQRLTAFTSVPRRGFLGKGLPGRLVDESAGAAEVAALYPNIDHVLFDTEGCDLLQTLTRLTDALDEPVQNGVNQLWVYRILEQARGRGIGVMLQGALGNATISWDGKPALIPMFQRGHWLRFLRTAYTLRKNGHLSIHAAAALATNGWQPRWARRLLSPELRDFSLDYSAANPAIVEQYGLYRIMVDDFFGDRPDPRTERAAFFERFDYGPLNAAARSISGIDPRDPCGDKRVFDFCYSIPLEQYLAGGMTRSLVRRAMHGRLPKNTLTRTVRGLQAADWYLSIEDALPSFRRELEEIQRSPTARHMLDLDRITRLASSWPESGYETAAVANPWGQALPRGVALGYFLRKWERVES